MSINEEILQSIISKTAKRNEKKEQILSLKQEILELRNRGLSISKITEYLKKAHKLKVTPIYLKKVIPELSAKTDYVANILLSMKDDEIVEVLHKLGTSRVRKIIHLYKQRYITEQGTNK